MFLQDGLEVGRGDGGSGEGEREGQTGVGDEDELELGGEGRGEELGEDSLADATEAKKRDGDGTENGSGEHCVVYRESAEYISLQMLFSFKQRVTTSSTSSIKKKKKYYVINFILLLVVVAAADLHPLSTSIHTNTTMRPCLGRYPYKVSCHRSTAIYPLGISLLVPGYVDKDN